MSINDQFTRQAQDMFNAAKDARIPENVQHMAEEGVAKTREAPEDQRRHERRRESCRRRNGCRASRRQDARRKGFAQHHGQHREPV